MSDHDFWDEFMKTAYAGEDEESDFAGVYLTASEKASSEDVQRVSDAIERRMVGRETNGSAFTSVRSLTDREREKLALQLPVEPGTKVQFAANMGAVLAYENPPAPNDSGVVVSVKSASGDITSHDGMVFVRWGDRVVRAVHAEHLRKASGQMRVTAGMTCIRVASLGDLSDFLRVAGSDDALVHKATKDLWKVRKDGADFVIERLFADSGAPIKV